MDPTGLRAAEPAERAGRATARGAPEEQDEKSGRQ
jgi:hypothetical protein